MTKTPQENPLAAWSLWLSQRPEFSNIQLARIPFTPNQPATMKVRDEILLSVGTQVMDANGYQVSDTNDVEIYGENDHLDVDAVFTPGVNTTFPLYVSKSLRWVQWLKTQF